MLPRLDQLAAGRQPLQPGPRHVGEAPLAQSDGVPRDVQTYVTRVVSQRQLVSVSAPELDDAAHAAPPDQVVEEPALARGQGATDAWTGGPVGNVNFNWSHAANWTNGVPNPGDDLVVDLPRKKAQRQSDQPAFVAKHALDRKVRFAGICRSKHGSDVPGLGWPYGGRLRCCAHKRTFREFARFVG